MPPVTAATAWWQVISRATLADISGCGVKALAWTVHGKVWRAPPEPLPAVHGIGAPLCTDITPSVNPRTVRRGACAQQTVAGILLLYENMLCICRSRAAPKPASAHQMLQ